MFLALYPNLKVERVSASLKRDGEQVTIRQVLELPPSDSDKILVSLDSLYGICDFFLSVKAVITFPRVVRD